MAIPNAPPVVFVTASQDSAIAVTALKAGAADYLVKDAQGEFIPLLQVACQRRAAAGRASAGARRGGSRGPRLARPLCGAGRRTRSAAARSQPPRRQLAADHRLAAAPAGQFDDPGRRQGGADQCDGPRRGGRAGASPALHLARPQERAAEPVSRSPARRPQAVGRGQQDVAADAEGRADRDRSGPRGGDRHHRQRTGDERRQIRLSRWRRADSRRAQADGDDLRAVDCRRRRRPQRQGRSALHRHGTTHRQRDGHQARRHRRARSRPSRHPDRAAVPPLAADGAEVDQRRAAG